MRARADKNGMVQKDKMLAVRIIAFLYLGLSLIGLISVQNWFSVAAYAVMMVALFIAKKNIFMVVAYGFFFLHCIPTIISFIPLKPAGAVVHFIGLGSLMFIVLANCIKKLEKTKAVAKKLFAVPCLFCLVANLIYFTEALLETDGISSVLSAISIIELPIFYLLFGLWITKDFEYVKVAVKTREVRNVDGAVYSVNGVRGRSLLVYENKCIITTTPGVGSFITGNASDGEKTIYYSDVIGVQFKQSGLQIGYLQLETASSQMNNRSDNFFNENSFTFDTTTVTNEQMEEISNYVKKQVEQYKRGGAPVVQQTLSSADELKKFKELLDAGVITQEEFDEKKKQLLNL